jgi:CBS domain containing-hemolysin-like protein
VHAFYGESIGVGLVGVITCFSLVIGERVPKRLALSNAEATALTHLLQFEKLIR